MVQTILFDYLLRMSVPSACTENAIQTRSSMSGRPKERNFQLTTPFMNEPIDADNDLVNPNDAVMESAAMSFSLPEPPIPAMVWNDPAGSAGLRTAVPPDTDPENIAEQLVNAGHEQAGSEQRQAASAAQDVFAKP